MQPAVQAADGCRGESDGDVSLDSCHRPRLLVPARLVLQPQAIADAVATLRAAGDQIDRAVEVRGRGGGGSGGEKAA